MMHICIELSFIFFQDLSGRPYLGYDLQIPTQRVGTYDTQVIHFSFLTLATMISFYFACRQLLDIGQSLKTTT